MTSETQNAVYDYFNKVISHGWTWARLTDDERERFKCCIDFSEIKGAKDQRIKTLNMVYFAFLKGVGYNPLHWREQEPELPRF